MLFEDEESLDLNNFDYSRKCVVVPLKACISLKDLWVPSHLLPNRILPLDNNKHKSGIFHTLEKKNYVESLSVYFEEEEKLDEGKAHTNEADTTCEKHFASNNEKQSQLNYFSSDENAKLISLSETELDNDKQISHFFANSQKLMYESFSDCLNCATNSPDKPNCDNNREYKAEQFVSLLDIINSSDESPDNSFTTAATNISSVEADVNEQPLYNEEVKCSEIQNVSERLEHVSECDSEGQEKYEKPLRDCQNASVEELNGDKMDVTSSKASLIDNQNAPEAIPVDQLSDVNPDESSTDCQATLEEKLPTDKMDVENSGKSLENDQCTTVKELPIAYKRPPLEEEKLTKKQRQQNKKKKNASNKNVQLADFIQKVYEDGCELPQRDEIL